MKLSGWEETFIGGIVVAVLWFIVEYFRYRKADKLRAQDRIRK